MKLVDILARDLDSWPILVSGVIAQDIDGCIFGWSSKPERDEDQWLCTPGVDLHEWRFGAVDLADDHLKSVVTRAQWQAAVDALKAESSVPQWIGDGPPPVGTVCEFIKHNSPPAPEGQWTHGEIRYLSDYTVIIGGYGCEHVHHPRNVSFRTVRTPEQIAADERDQASVDLAEILAGHDQRITVRDIEMAKYLYDIGYRKQADK